MEKTQSSKNAQNRLSALELKISHLEAQKMAAESDHHQLELLYQQTQQENLDLNQDLDDARLKMGGLQQNSVETTI